jgi:hypothetical protein
MEGRRKTRRLPHPAAFLVQFRSVIIVWPLSTRARRKSVANTLSGRGSPTGRAGRAFNMRCLALIKLVPLMERTSGDPHVKIGLIDGPVATQHPDLGGGRFRELAESAGAQCNQPDSAACVHGTFVAGILAARRSSQAPAICPNCTLLIRPVFSEATCEGGSVRTLGAAGYVTGLASDFFQRW